MFILVSVFSHILCIFEIFPSLYAYMNLVVVPFNLNSKCIITEAIFMSCSKVDRKSFESKTADWFRQAGARIKNVKKRTIEPTNEHDDNSAESA